MKDIKQIHRQAIEETDLALLARMNGDEQAAARHVKSAYELESRAANALLNDLGAEPTRSVLFRSAATLARDCGLFADAEKLIYRALAGEPPTEIVDELRDLLEQVTFHRHLELRGIVLGEEEIQMAISGKSIGFGMAPAEVFLTRARVTENLLYRTTERKENRPFRDRMRRDGQLAQNMELYMTAPRAACFAVTFRVGETRQQSLPGLSPGGQVIDELLDCLQLYTQGEEEQLKERIKEEAYFRNFVGLARTLQPDGARVSMVGFTTVRRGATKQVSLTRATNETQAHSLQGLFPEKGRKRKSNGETVELRGELLIADATKKKVGKQSGEIEIVTAGNVKVKVVVPPGMMSDIVKPLWESEVEVIGTRKGQKVHLVQIRPVS
jgi:hypothetical protein